ncbi:MAG: protein kinase [Deltaproteobacteria bacterium]|nr:protein kinase [Deltaproteobacteria bacterium]
MASLAGSTIDKYDIIEEVGHGGMAVVYRGLDRVLKREVAVKVLHPHLADRKESRLRLEREALAVAKLRHANILEIFDYSGPDAVESYIVTEFIHGMTLKQWVDDKLEPRPAVAAMIIHRLCLALQHAHGGGIVHRDIKPENVMIRRDGVLKLMDFGIAQIIDDQKLTLTGQLIGSPAYMAPELISGRPLDQRTDLFSLGILLYQLATGHLPFSGRNPHEVLNRIADGDYPLAVTVCPLVDRDLEDIIALALASDPDDRYQSVETFGLELARYLDEVGVEATNAELGDYFTDPADYIVRLDRRVCEALTGRAKAAAHDGETARAIHLLGRVLELDAAHAGATTLLQQLRQRERRNRRMLVVGASVLSAGLVFAVAQALPTGDPVDEGQAGTLAHAALRDRVDDDVSTALDSSTDVRTIPTVVPPLETSAPPAGNDAGAPPDPTEAAPGDTTAASVTNPGTTRRKAVTPLPPRVPVTVPCRLAFWGIPLPTAKNLDFRINTETHDLDAMRMDVDVEFAGGSATVRINDNRYTGYRRLTPAECAAGPVKVKISPLDAYIRFVGLPKGAAVACLDGCRDDIIGKNRSASNFPHIPITQGLTQPVRLVIKHIKHETITVSKDLLPGPNTIRVAMSPRADP